MKHVVFDIEGDGLLPQLTQIHTIVLRDLGTGKVMSCTDAAEEYYSMEEGLCVLANADRLYGHNILGYDIPAIKKVFSGWSTKADLLDTFTVCQMRWAHIKDLDYTLYHAGKLPAKFIGRHSLQAWGYRLGLRKIEFEGPWDAWSQTMQDYCEQDVGVNVELVEKIRRSGVTQLSLDIEHKLRVYLLQQEDNGWPFDLKAAHQLYAELADKREGLNQALIDRYGSWIEPHGKLVTPKRGRIMRKGRPAPEEYVAGASYQKIKVVSFNPSSRAHIAKVLKEQHGWVPREFTKTGLPQIDETTLSRAKLPEADMLIEYLTIQKRLGQVGDGKKSWLVQVTEESPAAKLLGLPMIHHQCWQNFAITARAAHRNPNLGQVPASHSPYGPQCRKLFTVPAGWDMLGADASGLELRCLAHYLAKWDDGEYADALLKSDIHVFNRDLLGLPATEEGRGMSKVFSYALIYGAGDEKLGRIVSPNATPAKSRSLGRELRDTYERRLPAFKQLGLSVKRAFQDHGYVRLIDGRRAYPRAEHSALNTKLQGTGAIICKLWITYYSAKLEEEYGPQGWNQGYGGGWAALGWIHDEVQLAARPAYSSAMGDIIVNEMSRVADTLEFRLPLTAEYKIGRTWYDTH